MLSTGNYWVFFPESLPFHPFCPAKGHLIYEITVTGLEFKDICNSPPKLSVYKNDINIHKAFLNLNIMLPPNVYGNTRINYKPDKHLTP